MEKQTEEKLIRFFNSKKYFFIKKILDIASFIIFALILWLLYNHIQLLLTHPCEICEDLGMVCIRNKF